MIYQTAEEWLGAANRRIVLLGMSGLGKTYISQMLRDSGGWYHYSVDYRIGTRYLGEAIADNAKKEAMKSPFLAELLRTDSIFIGSNLSFENLAPLSTYLGKPGNPEKGGLAFDEYARRQDQHRAAEIAALMDTAHFIHRSQDIYSYPHFVCDTSGSICEVVEPDDPDDPVLRALSEVALLIWIRGSDAHADELSRRFDKAPKPMYYHPDFLNRSWREYLELKGLEADEVDPDAFVRWTYRNALSHRQPLYRRIAENWGVTVDAADIAGVRDAPGFVDLIARTLGNAPQPA